MSVIKKTKINKNISKSKINRLSIKGGGGNRFTKVAKKLWSKVKRKKTKRVVLNNPHNLQNSQQKHTGVFVNPPKLRVSLDTYDKKTSEEGVKSKTNLFKNYLKEKQNIENIPNISPYEKKRMLQSALMNYKVRIQDLKTHFEEKNEERTQIMHALADIHNPASATNEIYASRAKVSQEIKKAKIKAQIKAQEEARKAQEAQKIRKANSRDFLLKMKASMIRF